MPDSMRSPASPCRSTHNGHRANADKRTAVVGSDFPNTGHIDALGATQARSKYALQSALLVTPEDIPRHFGGNLFLDRWRHFHRNRAVPPVWSASIKSLRPCERRHVLPGTFITSETNTHGDVTTTEYDDLSRVTTVTRSPGTADEAIRTYTYDPVWPREIATITDPLNHTTTFEYDERGNRKSIIDALNHKISFLFNPAGQVTSVTDPLQHTTTFEYAGGDLVKMTDPLGRVTQRFVDAAGRLLSHTDPAGQTTRFTYDKLNHVVQVTDALGGSTTYGYDPAGRLATITDALNHATTYGYDAFDRLASRTDPLSETDTFTYDVNGNPYQRTDRKGQVTTRTYDTLNRLHQITYADTSTITYTYDSGNRLTGGRRFAARRLHHTHLRPSRSAYLRDHGARNGELHVRQSRSAGDHDRGGTAGGDLRIRWREPADERHAGHL